ncbi:MAG: YraN family protein [Desulfuromonadales bacterium]|jgi:putative endonuclease|nr:YraN family protein [Desulfuromonadales bacterium]
MSHERLSLGARGEEIAVRYLQDRRFKILERNFATPIGEIDIIARQGRTLAFIEVKTRRSNAFGSPAEAVGPRKQRQILKTAKWYLASGQGRGLQPRFDVISILVQGENVQVEHIPAAFEA